MPLVNIVITRVVAGVALWLLQVFGIIGSMKNIRIK